MQKLLELINQHKDKLFGGGWDKAQILRFDDGVFIQIEGLSQLFSFSELFFSTEFLSLLEWNKTNVELTWKYSHLGETDHWRGSQVHTIHHVQFHKINLVLIKTDEERIKYIEENTL